MVGGEIGWAAPAARLVTLNGTASVTHRRFVQFGDTASSAFLPTVALGVGIQPAWSGLGLSVGAWIEQDLAHTVVHVPPGPPKSLPGTAARVEARVWFGAARLEPR